MHRPLASPSTRVLVSNEQRKCDCSWSPENVGVGAFAPPGKPRDARDDDPPVRARKPSNTTLIYEARTRRVFPMTTAYDVPPVLLIERIKEKLQAEGKIKPPEWAVFARTGVNTEKAPVQKDWWYRRVAAVLRKGYLHGPVGTSRRRTPSWRSTREARERDVDGPRRARCDPSAQDGGAAAGPGAGPGRTAIPGPAAGPTADDPPSDFDAGGTGAARTDRARVPGAEGEHREPTHRPRAKRTRTADDRRRDPPANP